MDGLVTSARVSSRSQDHHHAVSSSVVVPLLSRALGGKEGYCMVPGGKFQCDKGGVLSGTVKCLVSWRNNVMESFRDCRCSV